MTQNSFEQAPAYAPEDEGGNKKALLAAGIAASLALAAGGFFLLSGGSGEEETFLVPKGKLKDVAAPVVKPASVVPVVSSARLGRDPFKALYVAPVVAPKAVTAPATTTVTPTSVSPVAPRPAAPTSHALKLTRVYGTGADRTATFVIDGKTYLAKVGTVFGPTGQLKVLSLSQTSGGSWVATIQVGDSEPFDALLGRTLYVP